MEAGAIFDGVGGGAWGVPGRLAQPRAGRGRSWDRRGLGGRSRCVRSRALAPRGHRPTGVEWGGGEAAHVHVLLLHSTAWIVLTLGSPEPGLEGASPVAGDASSAAGPDSPASGAAPPASSMPPAIPMSGAAPLEHPVSGVDGPARVDAPLGVGPATPEPEVDDPKLLRLVRVNLDVGTIWRSRVTDVLVNASVEAGRKRGLSGSFHAGVIVAPDRDLVAVTEFPIGAGVVARGWARRRPLSGSVGLSAGVLVHRASTEGGVLHRVDPDLRLPLRFTWTPGKVGLSLGIVQGYSVRSRTYERRGVPVWSRIPYRIGLMIGLHFDAGAGKAKPRRSDGTRRTR